MSVSLCGMTFPNPVMPAAGPNGRDAAALLEAARGGAGGLVFKTVSVDPADVPHPNMAGQARGGLLNVELWSELPVERFLEKEYAAAKSAGLPVIASIGYTADELANLGPRVEATGVVDAIEFSIHYLGDGIEPVIESARALRDAVSLPILPKLSPGIPDPAGLARALEPLVDGIVAINSFGPVLDFDIETLRAPLGSEDGCGWLSGPALKPLALRFVRDIARTFRKPIIGVGGIVTGRDALQFIMAGATAVQVCTAAIRKGQTVYGKIAKEMEEWLAAHGYGSVEEAVGLFLQKGAPAAEPRAGSTVAADDSCDLCLVCVKNCIYGAIEQKDEAVEADARRCGRCGLCITVCPKKALHFEELS